MHSLFELGPSPLLQITCMHDQGRWDLMKGVIPGTKAVLPEILTGWVHKAPQCSVIYKENVFNSSHFTLVLLPQAWRSWLWGKSFLEDKGLCHSFQRPWCYPLETNCTDCKDGRLLYNPGQASFLLSRVSMAIVPASWGLGLPVQQPFRWWSKGR